jgi:hypothetical protein
MSSIPSFSFCFLNLPNVHDIVLTLSSPIKTLSTDQFVQIHTRAIQVSKSSNDVKCND